MLEAEIWKSTKDSVLVRSSASHLASRSVQLGSHGNCNQKFKCTNCEVNRTLQAAFGAETIMVGEHPAKHSSSKGHEKYNGKCICC